MYRTAMTLQVNEGGSQTLSHQKADMQSLIRQITKKSNIDNTFRRSQDTTRKTGGTATVPTVAKNRRKEINTVDLCETIKKGKDEAGQLHS